MHRAWARQVERISSTDWTVPVPLHVWLDPDFSLSCSCSRDFPHRNAARVKRWLHVRLIRLARYQGKQEATASSHAFNITFTHKEKKNPDFLAEKLREMLWNDIRFNTHTQIYALVMKGLLSGTSCPNGTLKSLNLWPGTCLWFKGFRYILTLFDWRSVQRSADKVHKWNSLQHYRYYTRRWWLSASAHRQRWSRR